MESYLRFVDRFGDVLIAVTMAVVSVGCAVLPFVAGVGG